MYNITLTLTQFY